MLCCSTESSKSRWKCVKETEESDKTELLFSNQHFPLRFWLCRLNGGTIRAGAQKRPDLVPEKTIASQCFSLAARWNSTTSPSHRTGQSDSLSQLNASQDSANPHCPLSFVAAGRNDGREQTVHFYSCDVACEISCVTITVIIRQEERISANIKHCAPSFILQHDTQSTYSKQFTHLRL